MDATTTTVSTTSESDSLPLPTRWYLCKYCNRAFHLREKLNIHTEQKHAAELQSAKWEEDFSELKFTRSRAIMRKSAIQQKLRSHSSENSGDEARNKMTMTLSTNTSINARDDSDSILNEIQNSDIHSISESQSSRKPQSTKQWVPRINLRRIAIKKRAEHPQGSKFSGNGVNRNKNFAKSKRKLQQKSASRSIQRQFSRRTKSAAEITDLKPKVEVKTEPEYGQELNLKSDSSDVKPSPSFVPWKFNCLTCGEYFYLNSHLEKHMRMVHGEFSLKKERGSRNPKANAVNTVNKINLPIPTLLPYFCPFCPMTFLTHEELSEHKNSHRKSRGKFPCSLCFKTFNCAYRLKLHSRSHIGDRPFFCNIGTCNDNFTCEQYLHVHQTRMHGLSNRKDNKAKVKQVIKIGVYPCPHCPKKFPTKQNLNQHLRSHSAYRPFKCSYEGCNAAYKTNQFFREHLRIHTGEKPYKCTTCGKEYARRFSYLSHARRHTDFYKKFMCQICNKKCVSNWDLRRHLASHDL